MARPGDASLIAIAITNISGQKRTRTIMDRTTSMIRFRNRPNRIANSAYRHQSPSFDLHTTNGSRFLVEKAGATLLPFHAGEEPLMTKCRELRSLHDVWNVGKSMSWPAACPLGSRALESVADHHCEFPVSEGSNITPSQL